MFLAVLGGSLVVAAPSEATVYSGWVADAQGDTPQRPLVEGPEWNRSDVTGVTAAYDDATGRVALTWDVDSGASFHPTRYWQTEALVHARMSEPDPDGRCPTSPTVSDVHLSGRVVPGIYGAPPPYDYTREGALVAGRATHPADVQVASHSLTVSAYRSELRNRRFRCVDQVTLTVLDWSDLMGRERLTGVDTVGAFRMGTSAGALEPAAPIASSAMYAPNETISASAAWRAVGADVRVRQMVITARRPGVPHSSGPYDDFSPRVGETTIAAGETRVLNASFRLPADAPAGRWELYATWQDASGSWHDGPSSFIVVTPRRPETGIGTGSDTGVGTGTRTDAGGATDPGSGSRAGDSGAPTLIPAADAAAPAATVRAHRVQLARALRRGLRLDYRCTERCALRSVSALIDARTASRLRLPRRVGSAPAIKALERIGTIRVSFAPSVRRKLGRLHSVSLELRLVVADASGNMRAINRRVTLRR